ncbi:MAG: aminoacyl--tRNA ligase-related protein [bacterium]
MKSKYIVISKNKKIYSAEEYLQKEGCSNEFKRFIEIEAYGSSKVDLDKGESSKYLYYANKMGFRWELNSPIGFMSCDYKANFILHNVEELARLSAQKINIPVYEVSGARAFDMSYQVVKDYAYLYGERLIQSSVGQERKIVFGYDGSYPQFNLASLYSLSYKQIPFAHFSNAECYRLEQSGECMLFYRMRQFHMPDYHPYFKDINEAWEGYIKIEKIIMASGKDVGIDYLICGKVSSEKEWEKNKKNIIEIAYRNKQDILMEILYDEKSYYWSVNIDYKIIDSFGQSREISCIQIDIENSKRLGISYIDSNNVKQYPVIIHSALIGGIERYLYMLFDDFKNRFPLWLSPIQLRLLPINESHIKFCENICKKYSKYKIRIDIDDRAESISKKIISARDELIPNYLLIGDKEVSGENMEKLDELIKSIHKKNKSKPFLHYNWPMLKSQQVR